MYSQLFTTKGLTQSYNPVASECVTLSNKDDILNDKERKRGKGIMNPLINGHALFTFQSHKNGRYHPSKNNVFRIKI